MTVEIEGVTFMAHPMNCLSVGGAGELMRHLLAAWMVVTETTFDEPAADRQTGRREKTTLLLRGKAMGRDVFIMQATSTTRPEDLLITPVIEGEGRLRYVARRWCQRQ